MKKTKPTGALIQELSSVSNINEYFTQNADEMIEGDLSDQLKKLTEQAGMNRSTLAGKAGLDRYYIYDIFSGRKVPSADKLICIALALELNLEETEKLLRLADRPGLYARHPRDSILIFAIQRHLTVDETNTMLYEGGQPLLSEQRE